MTKTKKRAAHKARQVVRHPVTSHRVNTVKGNGALPESQEVAPADVPIGEAMRLAVEELGDVTIDADLAESQLRQLADTYEEIVKAKAVFTAKNDAAKVAKKSLESVTELLLEKLRSFTHPTALPLFDAAAREQDHEAMLDAAD